MDVDVNGRYLVQRLTGQQRYATELVKRLPVSVIRPGLDVKGPAGHFWEQAVLPTRRTKRLLWSPSTTGPLAVTDQVVTIHDCAFFDEPGGFSASFALWYQTLIPLLARRVAHIITVSHFSKERIQHHCKVPENNISVIYSGVDSRFQPCSTEAVTRIRKRLSLPARFVLCVGSVEPRKNLRRLLDAWSLCESRLPDVSLLIAGGTSGVFRSAGIRELPKRARLLGYVDDELLPALYGAAEAFVYPSTYEGFGLPVIEAMACGAPVLTSAGTALREVAGDAARFVSPTSIHSIAEGLVAVLERSSLQEELRSKGYVRASLFSWDKCAQQHAAVLKRFCD